MKVGNISFTAAMLVQGEQNKLVEFYKELDKIPVDPGDSFAYRTHEHSSGSPKTMLIATGDDSNNLRQFKNAKELASDSGFLNKGNFYARNIKNYVNLPKVTYKVEDVLEKIKAGLFDFTNLAIRKK